MGLLLSMSPEERARFTYAHMYPPHSPASRRRLKSKAPSPNGSSRSLGSAPSSRRSSLWSHDNDKEVEAKAKSARRLNDRMVYLDGPQVYACAHWYV